MVWARNELSTIEELDRKCGETSGTCWSMMRRTTLSPVRKKNKTVKASHANGSSGLIQGPLNGGVSSGGVSWSGLVLPFLSFFVLFCPFLSFLGLSRFFWDFPDLLGDGPGIFPICLFPLSRPIKGTYEEQSRKGPRHNLDLPKKVGNPPVWKPPRFSFSQLIHHPLDDHEGEGSVVSGPTQKARALFFRFYLHANWTRSQK